MGLDFGTIDSMVDCIICVKLVAAVWRDSGVFIRPGGGSAFSWVLRWPAKLPQSVFLKLRQVTGVLVGSSVSKMLMLGRWSVFGGWAAGSILQLMNLSASSIEQKMLSGLV